MRWLFLVGLATLAGSCGGGDCAHGANIQVTVAPDGDVVVSDIVRLHVMLSINDNMLGAKDIDVGPDKPLEHMGSTFLLQPDPAPAASYDVSLTVQAYAVGGALVAIGSNSLLAVTNGCNRMTVNLTALPGMTPGPDMAAPPGSDLAGMMTPGPDMAGCVGGTPDEDADGRADFCDLCPDDSDPTPVDTDADGLPDACDPDVVSKTNALVYFEPFNAASGHWAGSNTVKNSYMILDTNGPQQLVSGNATDALPTNVRVQTHLFPAGYYSASSDIDAGLFVGTSTNLLASQTNGAWCLISTTDKKLELFPVQGGNPGTAALATIPSVTSQVYRLRLTNSGGTWTCEMLPNGGTPVTVTTTQPVTGPMFVTLIVDNGQVNYHSVVAESKL